MEKNHRDHKDTQLGKLTEKLRLSCWKPVPWHRTLEELALNTDNDQIGYRCALLSPRHKKQP